MTRDSVPAVTGLALEYAIRTDVGPVRATNEDSAYASQRLRRHERRG